MPQCSVTGCRSTTGVKTARSEEQYASWKNNLKKFNFTSRKNLRVCELHFTEEERDLQAELTGQPSKKKIKLDAIPSKHLRPSFILTGIERFC